MMNSLGRGVRDTGKKSKAIGSIAFKTTRNFVCIETQQKKLLLFLALNPNEFANDPILESRDVRGIGHFGTGDLEARVTSMADVAQALELIQRAYDGLLPK